ncbi:MAG: DUF2169 domain-containing protein [Sterolibacteriaceae bacterium]|nr:DUF2169 domain-containing protein [Sterolibacteriaceae bacterium]MBK9083953.1 DUF2169 domain-containing protein [Sterolibacteriaceae bacterium]
MNGPDNLIDAPVRAAALPEVRNHTGFPSQYYQMMDVADQLFHVMVSRLTYDMRQADDEGLLLLADEQTPLAESDRYIGAINQSSLIEESDYATFKPRCDILFAHAVAHAPGGKPSARWPVGVRIGDWQKRLTICGPRRLARTRLGWKLAEPEAVSEVPIRYEHAWGGTCRWPLQAADDEAQLLAREEHNPIGCGFADSGWLDKSRIAQVAAPQIEVLGRPFDLSAAGAQRYPVVGLGAIGRWWRPRAELAGTYDEAWQQSRWPRLPLDFDFGYWNCAPRDQQIAYPGGGEQVVMIGLHPGGEIRFWLPRPALKLLLSLESGVPLFKPLLTDTLIFDLQSLQLIVVQRALVAAAAGVQKIELGTWDIGAARRSNAAKLARIKGGAHG